MTSAQDAVELAVRIANALESLVEVHGTVATVTRTEQPDGTPQVELEPSDPNATPVIVSTIGDNATIQLGLTGEFEIFGAPGEEIVKYVLELAEAAIGGRVVETVKPLVFGLLRGRVVATSRTGEEHRSYVVLPMRGQRKQRINYAPY